MIESNHDTIVHSYATSHQYTFPKGMIFLGFTRSEWFVFSRQAETEIAYTSRCSCVYHVFRLLIFGQKSIQNALGSTQEYPKPHKRKSTNTNGCLKW